MLVQKEEMKMIEWKDSTLPGAWYQVLYEDGAIADTSCGCGGQERGHFRCVPDSPEVAAFVKKAAGVQANFDGLGWSYIRPKP